MPRARACVVGLGTDNNENRQLTTDAAFENWRQRRCRCNADDTHDAMMMRQKKIDTRRKRNKGGSSGTSVSGCHNWLLLLLLLSHYPATDTLLQILSLSGVVELTTQLLILENILWLPLVSNQQIWVEYSTLENCCDPLYLWVIKTFFWRRCRGA